MVTTRRAEGFSPPTTKGREPPASVLLFLFVILWWWWWGGGGYAGATYDGGGAEWMQLLYVKMQRKCVLKYNAFAVYAIITKKKPTTLHFVYD